MSNNIDIFSSRYIDAKELWHSKTRTYQGHLPRCWLYNLHRFDPLTYANPVQPSRLKELLDTGFLDIVIYETGSKNTGELVIDGASQKLIQYAQARPELYFIIQARQTSISGTSVPSSTNYVHPCYDSTGTVGLNDIYTHIGSNTDCPGPVANPTKYIEARYKTDISTYDDVRYPSSNNGIMPIPLFQENKPFWQTLQQFIYFNSTFSDLDSYTYLTSNGISDSRIKGMWMDFNDLAYPYASSTTYSPTPNKTIRTLCDNDPRFDYPETTPSAILGPEYKYWKLYTQTLEYRAQALDIVAPWMDENYCSLYTLVSSYAGPFSDFNSKFTRQYGRNKGYLEAYAFCYLLDDGITVKTVNHMTFDMARNIAQYALVDCHIFDVWWCASSYYGDLGSSQTCTALDDPLSFGFYDYCTIAQAIGFAKFMLASGGIKLIHFDNGGEVNHAYWSMLIAYDEVQDFYDDIKYGINYIPPLSLNRMHYEYTGQIYKTNCYDKDYYGNVLPSGVWIICRMNGTRLLFYGWTEGAFDEYVTGETSFVMRSPSNQPVIVFVSPTGSFTAVD